MRKLAHLAVLVSTFVMVGVGCGADTTTPVEPTSDESDSPSHSDGLVVLEYVGEVDVAKNTWSIRPALPSETDPKLAPRSWSRISGSGTPAPALSVATGPLTTGAGTVSAGTFASPSPASTTCAAGQQCGYVNIAQGTTGTPVTFSAGTAVIYGVSNGVTLANGESLPSDFLEGTAKYQNALPATTGVYFLQYGGVGAGTWGTTFTWAGGTEEARPWKWNLGTATGFTFNLQVWGIVTRTAYPTTFTSTTGTFIDACTATGSTALGSTLRALGKAATGGVSVKLDFPINIYDSASVTLGKPTTTQVVDLWVDGAITATVSGVGADSTQASSSGTGNLSNISNSGTPNYAIYPNRTNFTIASPSTGDLCYVTQGTAPARKMIFTWKNVSYAASTSNLATFSAVLYENSDQIEFQYSSMNPPSTITARAGIKGDASHYVCRLTAGSNCQNVRTVAASNTFFTLSPSTPSYVGP